MSNEILFLSHRIPFPPNRGDKIRSHHILRRLARMAPVHVGCFADDHADLAEEVELASLAHSYRLVRRAKPLVVAGFQAIRQGKPISLTAFEDESMAQYVAERLVTGRIGTIYVFSGQMGQYVPDDFAGRIIMDFVDVDSAKFDAYAEKSHGMIGGPMGWVYGREGRLLAAEEARLAQRADFSLLISQAEADLFAQRLGPIARDVRIEVLGNGIDAEYFDPLQVGPQDAMAQVSGPRLIFTGQMDYQPNIAAVIRAARQILPQVRLRHSGATLHIVGRNPSDAVMALDHLPGVYVWGRVDDVRPWLKAADMALVPLEIARGVQNKVLEAMAMELPVVLTSAAANGISAVAGQHFAVADSDEGLIELINGLADRPPLGKAMGIDARRLVVERTSWQSMLASLSEMLAEPPRKWRDAA